jgi:hypothetical protein
MRVENRENESQKKEESRQPARDFREHICRLRAENVFRHAAPKGCAQALAFWTLHQDHEDHEERDKNIEPEQDIDQNGHRDGQYRQPAQFVNEGLGARRRGVGAGMSAHTGVIPSRADGEGPTSRPGAFWLPTRGNRVVGVSALSASTALVRSLTVGTARDDRVRRV